MNNLRQQLEDGTRSSEEIVGHYLQKIKEKEPQIKAFITVTGENALNEARASDQRCRAGKLLSPWDGIPIAIKDNICTKNIRTTCASHILDNYVSPFDATVVSKLRSAGLITVGKTNLDEFAMGSSTEYSAFQITHNPHDLTRVAGGSSGGSAAAVASEEVPWALGTDTGGSIRQPAAFCGVVGLKPTYGRISRYGIVALASSLDQVGPIATNVADTETLFSLIAGVDPKDATSDKAAAYDHARNKLSDLQGIKVGIPAEFFAEGLAKEVEVAILETLAVMEDLGATLLPISLPHNVYSIDTYLTIVTAEASSNLARYDGVRYGLRVDAPNSQEMFAKTRTAGFGIEVKRRIMLGTYVLSASQHTKYYETAQRVRTLIREELEQAFQTVDLIVTPTTPTTAFRIGEKLDPLQMYLSDSYTASANLTGVPALTMPCGKDRSGLPIGVQFMANHFQEESIFLVTQLVEKELMRRLGNGEL